MVNMMFFRLKPEISVSPVWPKWDEIRLHIGRRQTLPIVRLVPSWGLMMRSGKLCCRRPKRIFFFIFCSFLGNFGTENIIKGKKNGQVLNKPQMRLLLKIPGGTFYLLWLTYTLFQILLIPFPFEAIAPAVLLPTVAWLSGKFPVRYACCFKRNTCPRNKGIRSKASEGPRSGISLQWWKLTLSWCKVNITFGVSYLLRRDLWEVISTKIALSLFVCVRITLLDRLETI